MHDSAHNPAPRAGPAPAAPPSEAVALELGALEATLPPRPSGTADENQTSTPAVRTGKRALRRLLPLLLVLLAGCLDRELPTGPAGSPGPSSLLIPISGAFTQLSAGRNHSCALTSIGIVQCWGDGADGQAPDWKAPSLGTFTQVSAGGLHSCALRDDGVVECWGSNDFGAAPTTQPATSGRFTQVTTGWRHTCALRDDGVVECWGNQSDGAAPATREPATGHFTHVSATEFHTCAVRDDGAVECWGRNHSGQAPALRTAAQGLRFTQVTTGLDHSCALREDGWAECWGWLVGQNNPAPAILMKMGGFSQVSSGRHHVCGLWVDGVVRCTDALLLTHFPYGQAPDWMSATTGSFTQVSSGQYHTCALRTDGAAECWGNDEYGQAPAGRDAVPLGFAQVSTADEHSCAVTTDGVIQCWGLDGWRQAPSRWTASSGRFTRVSSSSASTCAVRTDGVVECRGDNHDGDAPAVRQPAAGSFTEIAKGWRHACALRDDGAIECWGKNDSGQAPALRTAGQGFTYTQVAASESHSCAVRIDGLVECWGLNLYGQATGSRPAQVGHFTRVSSTATLTCALRNDGQVECWGQIALGTPVKQAGQGQFIDVDVGDYYACAPRTDGAVECWTLNRADFAPPAWWPSGGAPFTQVSASPFHRCAVTSRGAVECKGNTWFAPPIIVPDGSHTSVLPVATFGHPETVEVGLPIALSLTGAHVPNHSAVTDFTYAFDCGNGIGFSEYHAGNTASCGTTIGGLRAVKGRVRDRHGHVSEYTGVVTITGSSSPGATFPGASVEVKPLDQATGESSDIIVRFSSVTGAGETSVTSWSAYTAEVPPPSDFKLGDPPTYYDIKTTATFSGSVRICISFADVSYDDIFALELLHYHNGAWQRVASSWNYQDRIVCGDVSGFSFFAVAQGSGSQFSGFFPPVDNPPVLNVAKAGSAIPVKFSLGGDQGLNIFASGSPGSQTVGCENSAAQDAVTETVTAGGSKLSYDAATQRYTYVWKTDKAWAGSCRTLTLQLTDGATKTANFKFTR